MEKSPAFQWYSRDILASARVTMMTLEEEGAYRRALDFCWLNGTLPADPELLARLIGKGCSVEVADRVREMFTVDKKNPQVLLHDRLEIERKKQAANRKKRAKAGRASAESRKKKKELEEPEEAEHMLNTCSEDVGTKSNSSSSSASSSASAETKEKEESLRDGQRGRAVASPTQDDLLNFRRRDGLIEHLKGKLGGHALANPRAESAAALWLVKYGDYSDDDLIACLDSQLADDWRKKVSWLTVKSEIARFVSKPAQEVSNGKSKESVTEQRLRERAERHQREDAEARDNFGQGQISGRLTGAH